MNNKKKLFTILGRVFFSCAVLLTLFFIKEDRAAGRQSAKLLKEFQHQNLENTEEILTDTEPYNSTQRIDVSEKQKNETKQLKQKQDRNKNILGILEIPKLKRFLPVWNTYSEEQLKMTVCRYGEKEIDEEQLIIAGHSYRSHFGKLGTLKKGDEILFTNSKQEKMTYTVSEVTEIDGNDREGLFSGKWDLTLFTCNLGGKKRILVRCKRT